MTPETVLGQLFEAGISSLLDPDPVRFTPRHRKGLDPLRRILEGGPVLEAPLPRPLLRNQVLYGCLEAVGDEELEHLIVRYGAKRSSGTDVWMISHLIGGAGEVSIPPVLQQSMNRHLAQVANAELIVLHNHPRWWANEMVNNRPVASRTDRDTMVNLRYRNGLSLFRLLTKSGGILFFLCENGKVRKIRAPSVATVAEFLGPPS